MVSNAKEKPTYSRSLARDLVEVHFVGDRALKINFPHLIILTGVKWGGGGDPSIEEVKGIFCE